jgi:ABC-type multidrug transport system fused ATPase/permease subunit
MLIPALSAVLAVSAPGVLLSASVLFLLLGFGIYLGFVWSRALDADAGKGDSRDVFIVYIIVLAVVYMVYTLSDIYQDYGTDATVRGAIERTINKMQLEWPEIIRARAESYIERQKDRDIQQQQLATLTEILQVKYDNKRIRAEMGGIPPDETETADVQ